ncbi:MAG: DUF4197 domain-containing protein [Bacteroidales bacterium]|nr:DUF4197 domain-containing protein [Bacteroidales bacterium]
MKKLPLLALAASMFAMVSCDELGLTGDGDLSTAEVVKGLKTALNIGTDSSTAELSLKDGYYGNPLIKIPLPDEAEMIMEKMEYIGKYSSTAQELIETKMESLREAINRSAEDAAKDAKPIFTDAITNLSIVDGWEILNGVVPGGSEKAGSGFDSLAATKYLKNQTYNALVDAYSPKMDAALDKKFVGNASATSLWNDITSNYNGLVSQYGKAATLAAQIMGKDITFKEVDTDLGEFVTAKALDGLFVKVGAQEKEIRKNPFQWASDIIQKVFGAVANTLNGSANSEE